MTRTSTCLGGCSGVCNPGDIQYDYASCSTGQSSYLSSMPRSYPSVGTAGYWGSFSGWSACSPSCGTGTGSQSNTQSCLGTCASSTCTPGTTNTIYQSCSNGRITLLIQIHPNPASIRSRWVLGHVVRLVDLPGCMWCLRHHLSVANVSRDMQLSNLHDRASPDADTELLWRSGIVNSMF